MSQRVREQVVSAMELAPGKKDWACLAWGVVATKFKKGVVREGFTAKLTLEILPVDVQDLILS